MALADLLDANTFGRRGARTLSDLLDDKTKQEISIATSNAATRKSDLASDLSEKTMPDEVSIRQSEARGQAYGLPEKALEARKAGINLDYLNNMMTPQADQPNVPPYLARPDAPPSPGPASPALPPGLSNAPAQPSPPPAILARLQGMSLDELRQEKMKDSQMGGVLSQYIDPVLGVKMQAEKKAMYDDLNSPAWQKKIADIGTKNTNASQAFNEFRTAHPVIAYLPETEQAKLQTESFKANAQPNMAMMMGQPIQRNTLDDVIRRIASGQSTVGLEMARGFNRRPDAMQVHDQIVEGVRALKPDYSEAEDESGYAYSKSPKVKTALAQMDNSYSTIGRLQKIFSKLDNGQFPTLNAAFNAGKFQAGDVDAARASIGEILGNDELSKALAGGGVTTDKLRDMSAALVNKSLSPGQMTAQFDELLQGIARQRSAYETQAAGHIKPMNIPGAPAKPISTKPAPGATGPLTKAEAHWYLDQVGNDVAKAKVAAQRDGRTF